MDWDEKIDDYCERTGSDLFAEPMNLVSNMVFIVAACFALRLYLRNRRYMDPGIAVLIGLISLIGIGSGLFHSFATRWAMVADVAPITAFMCVYLGYYLRAIAGWSWGRVGLGYAGFLAVSGLTILIPPDWFNGSQAYFAALFALLVLAPLGRARDSRLPGRLYLAAGVFAISLSFRSVDDAVCGSFPWGTHFLWHTSNGFLLYLLVHTAIEARASRSG